MFSLEYTLVILKPEVFKRGLVGRIIQRLIEKNLRIIHIHQFQFTKEVIYEQYKEYMGVESIRNNITFSLIKGPSLAIVLQGHQATKNLRNLVGFYKAPEPGTIRGTFMISLQEGSNIHASDNPTEFLRDIRRLCISFYTKVVLSTIERKN